VCSVPVRTLCCQVLSSGRFQLATRQPRTHLSHPHVLCRRRRRRAGRRRPWRSPSTGGRPGAAGGSNSGARACAPMHATARISRSVGRRSARTPAGRRPRSAASGGGRRGGRIASAACLDLPPPAIDAPAGGSGGRARTARGPRAAEQTDGMASGSGCEARGEGDYADGLLLQAMQGGLDSDPAGPAAGRRRGRARRAPRWCARGAAACEWTATGTNKAGHVIARSITSGARVRSCLAGSPAGPAEVKAGGRQGPTATYTTRGGARPWAERVVWWRLPSHPLAFRKRATLLGA